MSLTLTDVSTVRERGALQAPPSAGAAGVPGAVTDAQIDAAIQAAYYTMVVDAVGFLLYSSVKDMSDEDKANTTPDPVTGRTNKQKFTDFKNAESYFALMHIEKVVQVGKVSETGTPSTFQIGRETRTFAPVDEVKTTGEAWEEMAYTCLKPYITLVGTDADGNLTFVANKKQSMIMAVI